MYNIPKDIDELREAACKRYAPGDDMPMRSTM